METLNWGKQARLLFLLCAATAIGLPAQTFTKIHNFDATDGQNPYGALTQGTDGYLYGTTYYGGTHTFGSVFKVAPDAKFTTLYSFCPTDVNGDCTDGAEPYGGLVQSTDGSFYGTTTIGGPDEGGTVFKITSDGTLTTLYGFVPGTYPYAALIQATDGNFYGTTSEGGAYGYGNVFEITPGGTLTTLYSFCSLSNCADGSYPDGGLIQAADGNFYGTTAAGGSGSSSPKGGGGTVFKITPAGTLTTLYNFCSQSDCTDGEGPTGALVQSADGDFYGTTSDGGANLFCDAEFGGCGTVFRITPSGALATIYSFCYRNGCTDGTFPSAGLVLATDGSLYGTTKMGGDDDAGSIFKTTPGGTLTTLYSFCRQPGCTDGEYPVAALVQDTNGEFYGTASQGGPGLFCGYGCGTIFSLSVGLGPFVETRPTSARVGTLIDILGTELTGATSITFNGARATFKVVSSSFITATVPAGATTGTVQVVTPGETLSSNLPFRVIQ
jgi:uncharacterized repeat protein (TIGR03803 family)